MPLDANRDTPVYRDLHTQPLQYHPATCTSSTSFRAHFRFHITATVYCIVFADLASQAYSQHDLQAFRAWWSQGGRHNGQAHDS